MLFRSLSAEAILQKASCEGIEVAGDQEEHVDAAPGHCFDKRTDKNIEMFLDGNILHPLSIWIPMHEDIGLNVFLSSHLAALACLRCHREHYQRVRMQWNQTHPKGTDDQFYPHWVAFVVRHLEKDFTAEQRIRGKRLVVQK